VGLYLGKSGWHIRWCWGNKKTTFGLLAGDLNMRVMFLLYLLISSLHILFFFYSVGLGMGGLGYLSFSLFLFFHQHKRIWSGFSITWLDWDLGKRSRSVIRGCTGDSYLSKYW